MVDEPKRSPPSTRATTSAIPGDVEVAIPVFEACVRVGKLERAAVVLKRLQIMKALDPQELMELHNQYLEAYLRHIKADPGIGKAEDLHAWYEVHIHEAGLPQTPATIAYMLKASLLTTSAEGTRLARLIQRYMGIVPPEQGLDVLYCTDILSDSDIAAVTTHFPEFNITAFSGAENGADDDPSSGLGSTFPAAAAIGEDSSVPNVLETPQRGSGLYTIQSTLSIFRQMKDGSDISRLPPLERREFQARLERDCIDAAMERWRENDENLKKMGLNTSVSGSAMGASLWEWHKDLEAHLKLEFTRVQKAEKLAKKNQADSDRCVWGPVLMQSTPTRLAAVTILGILNSLVFSGVDKGVPLSIVLSHVARITEEDIQARKFEQDLKQNLRKGKVEWVREQQLKRAAAANEAAANEAAVDEAAVDKQAVDEAAFDGAVADEAAVNEAAVDEAAAHEAAFEEAAMDEDAIDDSVVDGTVAEEDSVPKLATPHITKDRLRSWPLVMRTKIGAILLSGLAKVAKVRVIREHPETQEKVVSMQPALSHCHQFRRGRKIGLLIAHPVLAESMRKEPRPDFLARHLPMVVEPESWSKFDKGAYIECPVPIVRTKPGEQDQRLYAQAAIERGDMEQVMKGLDVLGKTAWRINRNVFDVFLEAWNSGDPIAKVPPLNPDIQYPEEPEPSADPLVRRHWVKTVKQAHNLKMSYHSIRCYMNFQLEIARAFRDQEFFFPHNIDFRGRAYPIPTYLNHMGADHVRGLLRFSKGRELGERGVMWLKVHLANVYGYDKASLKGRASFCTDHLADVYDSASNPLKGKRWWLTAEDPWQCLAACFELKAALDSPDPTKFVSSLPIHQDGTCNGLQHYAALGGDTWGAKQVNLAPGDKPADVYSAVADLVKKDLDADILLGHPIAKAMEGKVKRKVVKQTVMTNVYGVTFMGAKKQVLRQIEAHYPTIEKETGVEPGLIASYITTKIFKALSTMFKGAHDIQYWLGEIGSRVCRALTAEQIKQVTENENEPASGSTKAKRIVSKQDLLDLCRSTIIWTTPLRMPVVQPYRKNSSKVITTCLQSLILQNPNRFDPVNRRKQLQAFPPNFIHSLDASHMLLSALECSDLGLTFAAVHDSFWTHAADVDVMNRVLRDAFIRIHSEHVIKRLLSEFDARYKGGLYLAQIDRKSPAGVAILKWRAGNRRLVSGREELVVEKERLDLLNSDNPADREKGKKLVTPASLYEELASKAGDDVVGEDLSGTTLGSMSSSASGAEAGDDDLVEGATITEEDAVEGDEDDNTLAPEADAASAEAAGEAGDDGDDGDDHDNHADHGEDIVSKYTDMSHFQERLARPVKRRTNYSQPISVWLPMSFPDVPQKGDFDVTQLRNSDYFFS